MSLKPSMVDRFQGALVPTYSPAPFAPVRGEGCRIWDAAGREYLDAVGGIAVASLGHAHPDLVAAIGGQASRIMAISNHYLIEEEILAAEALVGVGFPGKVFFCNSGAEANEAAVKFARRFFHAAGDAGRNRIVTFEGAFHGRTLAMLAATGKAKFAEGFGPLPGGFVQLPFNRPGHLTGKLDRSVAAILLEIIQGESGVNIATAEFLDAVRKEADRIGALVIVDEVQTGTGRTGAWFAYQHRGPKPDIITLAKGIGGGVPVGACLATHAVSAALSPGAHGSTFGGNPLAMRAVRCVVEVIRRDGLVAHAGRMGERLLAGLRQELAGIPAVREVRGMGLMVGVELDAPAQPVADAARDNGLVVNVTEDRVLRFLPPLVISEGEVDRMVDLAVKAVREAA